MKIQITFKCPDALDDAIQRQIEIGGLPPEDKLFVKTVASKWIDYGEYVTIEVDTETKTAIVLPA